MVKRGLFGRLSTKYAASSPGALTIVAASITTIIIFSADEHNGSSTERPPTSSMIGHRQDGLTFRKLLSARVEFLKVSYAR